MPKKNSELKAKAKQLYEKDGFSLAEIARKLDINNSTVKTWKNRGKWVKPVTESKTESTKPGKKQKRILNPNSLANLDGHKYPNVESGNKLAEKHGLYSDHSDDPEYEELFHETLNMSEEELARERIAASRANYIIATKKLDKTNPAYLEPLSRVDASYGNLLKRPSEIRANELDNQMREYKVEEIRQQVSGDSPLIEKIQEYIDVMENHANTNE